MLLKKTMFVAETYDVKIPIVKSTVYVFKKRLKTTDLAGNVNKIYIYHVIISLNNYISY